jgi:hypothetical protein
MKAIFRHPEVQWTTRQLRDSRKSVIRILFRMFTLLQGATVPQNWNAVNRQVEFQGRPNEPIFISFHIINIGHESLTVII